MNPASRSDRLEPVDYAPSPRGSAWPHRIAIVTAVATGLLIVAGGLVTSLEAGMAVPDWPTSFGYNMFTFPPDQWQGGIFYEHSHRLLGSGVGLLTILLALLLWLKDARRWIKWLGAVALVAVIGQGVLGGIRVNLQADYLAIPHACLAQAFFALTVAMVLFTSRSWHDTERATESIDGLSLRWVCVAATAAIYVQMILGALLRHADDVMGDALHGHLFGAFVVMAAVIWLAVRIFGQFDSVRALTRPAGAVLVLFIIQVGLGLGALATRMVMAGDASLGWVDVVFATSHVAVGALLLAACVTVMLRAFRVLTPRATAGPEGASV
jgi:cytochrome c oxidase assembly protein subunit 15